MSATLKIFSLGFLLALAIGLGPFSFEMPGIVSPQTETLSKRKEQIQNLRSLRPDSTEQATVSRLIPASITTAEPNSSGRQVVRKPGEALPGWTVPYGKEFWRRSIKPTEPKPKEANNPSAITLAEIGLGDIMDRVSHAFTEDDSSGVRQVRAKTYTAAFDATGVRFSPHRPGTSEVLSGQESTDVPPVLDCGSPLPLFTARAPVQQRQRTAAVQDAIAPVDNRGQFPLPDPDTEVTLSTRSVRVGERILYERHDRTLSWSLLGNTCQALLNERIGLVEHYEAGGEGVQVSWVLKERPAGEGALEIKFEVEGLSYAGASDRGLHLADATGTPRLRIGKAFAVDSAARRSEVALVGEAGCFYVRVSGEILAYATYPLAIDPLISPEFGMDEPVTVPRPGEHALPAVAWNGTNWLVVWTEWFHLFDSPVDVVGARVSRDGQVLDPFGVPISQGNPPPAFPAVASNGKDFLVVWEAWDFNTGPDIHGRRVTASGQLADEAEIVISGSPYEEIGPSVAADREGYVVVWQRNSSYDPTPGTGADIFGTRVSNEGLVLAGDGFPISTLPGNQSLPSVASGPNGFLVVWSDGREFAARGDDIYGARLDRNGTVLDTNGIAICTASKNQWFPCVAGGCVGYWVVWQDYRNSAPGAEQTDIYGTPVTSAGEVTDPQGIVVSGASGYQGHPCVAAGINVFLVVWNDGRTVQPGIYASRVSPLGDILDPNGVLIDSVPRFYSPAVAASDDGFLVVWDRSLSAQGGFGAAIWGARLSSQAEVIDSEAILVTLKDNDQGTPAVASNGTNWLVVWADGRTLTNWSDIYGVRIGYDGTVLDPAAIAISTQPGFEMAPTVASAGADYLVVWTDSRNSPPPFYDIYGARIRGDGTVVDPGGIAISLAPGTQINPTVTSDGTNYLVVWQSGNIYAARVSREGDVLEPDGFPISAGAGGKARPSVAFNGNDFLAVWEQWQGTYGVSNDVYGTRISTGGLVLDAGGIAINRAPNAQLSPAVASSGAGFLVVWDNYSRNAPPGSGEIYGARITPSGLVLDPNGFRIAVAPSYSFPAIAFNGINYLAVWEDGRPGDTGLLTQTRAACIDRSGNEVVGNVLINNDGAHPVVAVGPSNSFLVVSEGMRNGAARVVGNLVSFVNAPLIQSLTLTVDGATLSWRAETGKTYRVQFKPDLDHLNWNYLAPLVTATNSAASLRDPTIGQDSQRFYRVLQLP